MSVLSIGLFTSIVVNLRGSDGFGPVVGPVEVIRIPWVGVLTAEDHAVDEAAYERDEAED